MLKKLRSSLEPIDTISSVQFCPQPNCKPGQTELPNLASWNATGNALTIPRYLLGKALESAHIFLVGGQSTNGVTNSVESTIW